MIECIFTIDYEIYGNGEGSLRTLVYEPAQKLKSIFDCFNAKLVAFIELAELEMIEAVGSDPAMIHVKEQIRDFFTEGFEIGLHLHPQWYNAKHESGRWLLDYSEYNLCVLKRDRVAHIIDRSLCYLRNVLGAADYTPFSFRAGNWLFQPTENAAKALAERGIKVDSSVFKGGLQHQHHLDYRAAERNRDFWRFGEDVNTPDPNGALLEVPIYTQMVLFWKMATGKRIGLQHKGSGGGESGKGRLSRLKDFLRFKYPLKFDFCRMTLEELTRMLDAEIQKDREDPNAFKPLVAIGHTKDLVDTKTVESFLTYLDKKRIPVSTFKDIYIKCVNTLESQKAIKLEG